jgi:hypothetical protein
MESLTGAIGPIVYKNYSSSYQSEKTNAFRPSKSQKSVAFAANPGNLK